MFSISCTTPHNTGFAQKRVNPTCVAHDDFKLHRDKLLRYHGPSASFPSTGLVHTTRARVNSTTQPRHLHHVCVLKPHTPHVLQWHTMAHNRTVAPHLDAAQARAQAGDEGQQVRGKLDGMETGHQGLARHRIRRLENVLSRPAIAAPQAPEGKYQGVRGVIAAPQGK